NSPLAPRRIDRMCSFMPIATAVRVVRGDRIAVSINVTPEQSILSWKVKIFDQRGDLKARSTHSSLRGMLLTREALLKTRTDFAPRLTRRGEARRAVLGLCDGRHKVADIENVIFELYREVFNSREKVSQFVAEVAAPNSVSDATTEGKRR